MKTISILFGFVLIALSTIASFAATVTVTGTGDTIAVDTFVTLPEAITSINNGANVNADVVAVGAYGTNDTINFTIPGAGVHTIAPTSALPNITKPMTINGYSQPTASANTLAVGDNAALKIEIDGTNAGGVIFSLTAGSSGSTIRGLVFNRNKDDAILIENASNNNFITGNFFGTDPAGSAAVSTNGFAVAINFCTGTTIGGTSPADRNVMSANSNVIELNGGGSHTVQGNYIGVNAAGTTGLPCFNGINIEQDCSNNTIGGSAAGARNVIGQHQQFGIVMNADGNNNVGNNVIQGNFIGTDATGTVALGGGSNGIHVGVKPNSNNLIGGTNAGEGNVIAFNGGAGVLLTGDGVRILGNSIFSNGTLGIDLGADGITANDSGDGDNGANNLQNFPVITQVTNSSGMATINGTLNSIANTTFRIEFFGNDTIDPTDFGEGKTFLGFVNATTDGTGNVSFSKMVPKVVGQPHITATATDPNGNTSEFSAAYGQLLNISTREKVLTNNSVLIGGFIVTGDVNKQVLLRALGPTLMQFNVNGILGDPTLELHDGTGALIVSNDNWKDTQQADISATGKAPSDDHESAILRALAPGNYTAIVRGKNNTTGVALVEVYDLDDTASTTLTNISSRGFVDVGQNVMIGGFISGNGQTKVIIRALGPTLSQFHVPNVLTDPMLEVHDAAGNVIASNDNWKDTQQAEIQASGFAPPDDKESAIIINRPSGNTTAIVKGVNNSIGNALVEVYQIP